MFLDGAQLLVECECERILPGWAPRRLGKQQLHRQNLFPPLAITLSMFLSIIAPFTLGFQFAVNPGFASSVNTHKSGM